MLNFTTFFILGAVFLIWILCFFDNRNNRITRSLTFYLVFFVGLFCLSILTLHNYVYPVPHIFKNVDYHILEHTGYRLQDSIVLIDDESNESLLESKKGYLSVIHQDSMHILLRSRHVTEPIYTNQKDSSCPPKLNYSIFNYENYLFQFKDSIHIKYNLQGRDSSFITIKIQEELDSTNYIIEYPVELDSGVQMIQRDTSTFKNIIHIAYPLKDIISGTGFNQEQLSALDLDDVLLARKYVSSPLRKLVTDYDRSLNPLQLFIPETNIGLDVFINNQKCVPLHQLKIDSLQVGGAFFIGIKKVDRERVFVVSAGDRDKRIIKVKHSFKFSLHKKAPIGTLVSHFLTSNHQEVLYQPNKDSLSGGYFVNEFSSEKNANHFIGQLRYFVGNSRENMEFEITDFQSKRDTPLIVAANDTFALQTQRGNNNWLFTVNNARAVNPIHFSHIILFLALITLLVVIRYTLLYNRNDVYRIELAIYVIVFCFVFFRTFLQWRIGTFYPIELIDYKQFSELVGDCGRNFWGTAYATLIFFWGVWAILFLRRGMPVFNYTISWRGEIPTNLLKYIWAGAVIGFVLSFFNPFFERLANLFIPLTIYFIYKRRIGTEEEEDIATGTISIDKANNRTLFEQEIVLCTLLFAVLPIGLLIFGLISSFSFIMISLIALSLVGIWLFFKYLLELVLTFVLGLIWILTAIPFILISCLFFAILDSIASFFSDQLSIRLPSIVSRLIRWIIHEGLLLINNLKESIAQLLQDSKHRKLILFLGVIAYLALMDAGYAIMFLIFAYIYWFIVRVIVFPKHSNGLAKVLVTIFSLIGMIYKSLMGLFFGRTNVQDERTNHANIELLAQRVNFILLGAIFILIVYTQNSIITLLLSFISEDYSYLQIIFLGMAFLLALFAFLEWGGIRIPLLDYQIVKLRSVRVTLFALLSGVILMFSTEVNEQVDKFSYIRYRADILNNPIDSLILQNNFDSKDIRQIQRASHNQWLINYYYNEAKQKDSYFKLQPHFNQGSSHITQASDLIITRYVISEHSEVLVLSMIGMFLLLIIIYFFSMKRGIQNEKNLAILEVTVLLFTTALFVWMTATNRFTFFGQDFPLLPVASRITMLLTFVFFLFMISHLEVGEERKGSLWGLRRVSRNNDPYIYITGVFTLLGILYCLDKTPHNARESRYYDVTDIINESNKYVKDLNNRFLNYQERISGELTQTSVHTLLDSFHNVKNEELRANFIDPTASSFIKTAYEGHFIKNQKDKKDPDAFIHIRTKMRGTVPYRYITLNRKFFFIKSPEGKDNGWKNNIQAAKHDRKFGLLDENRTYIDEKFTKNSKLIKNLNQLIFDYEHKKDALYQNILITVIPLTWTPDSTAIYIIRRKGDSAEPINKARYTIHNDTFAFVSTKNNIGLDSTRQAVRLLPGDRIVLSYSQRDKRYNKKIKRYRFMEQPPFYLAKNIWINGERRLFYPLVKELNWSYSFAKLLNDNRSSNQSTYKETYKDDVVTSIDYELTEQLYNQIDFIAQNKALKDFTVFVDADLQAKKNKELLGFVLKEDRKRGVIPVVSNKKGLYASAIHSINRELKKIENYSKLEEDTKNSKINECINDYFGGAFDMGIVTVDGNGKIRTLVDYNRIPRRNPNNTKEFNQFLNKIYSISSNTLEMDYFGNINLMRTKIGVGSTFKPFVYAAITSQIKIDWEGLKVDPPTAQVLDSIRRKNPKTVSLKHNGKELVFFGGKQFSSELQYLGKSGIYWNNIASSDYKRGLSSNTFLTKSNNIYHGTIMLLGSFPIKEIRDSLRSSILVRKDRDIRTLPYKFPSVSLGGRKYVFKGWPQFNEEKTALAQGLYNNFDFKVVSDQKEVEFKTKEYIPFGTRDNIIQKDFEIGADKQIEHFYWAFPEWSDFLQMDRSVDPVARKGLINPALGGFPIRVSPLKMAEMGARLFTMDRTFNLSILDEVNRHQNRFFYFDKEGWRSEENLFQFYRRNIYKAMHNTTRVKDGTARGLRQLNDKYEGTYWFYAKTGTTNDSDNASKKNLRSKRLLLIITNRPIHEASSKQILNDASYKVYSIFITINDIEKAKFGSVFSDDWRGIQSFVESIIDSKTFNDYMNE